VHRPLLAVLLLLVLPATASAIRLDGVLEPVPGNPAEALVAHAPPEPPRYDRARGCTHRAAPGARRLEVWLSRNAAGTSWGIERCERWGAGTASLHAEGRAVDWHLDSRDPAQRRAGVDLVELLLAPDSTGEPHALARRMGIQEIIWDCSIWTAGSEDFGPYAPCFGRDGRTRRRRVNATVAHFDHLHIGLTRAGAAATTSFWRAR
jgi:hypothetical protein